MPGNQNQTADEPLTAAQMRFREQFVEHGNATRAFREAGLTAKNPTAARRAASWLLAKPGIHRYVEEVRRTMLDAARRSYTEHLNKIFPR